MNLAALVASLKLDASDYFAGLGKASQATQDMGREAADTAAKLGSQLGGALDTAAASSKKTGESIGKLPPTLQQVEDALKGLGVASSTELHLMAEEATKAAEVVKRGFDANKASLVDYQLAQRAATEAQIQASRASDSLIGDVNALEAEYKQLTQALRDSGVNAKDSLGLMETKTKDVTAELQRMGQALAIGGAALTATVTRPIMELATAALDLGSKFSLAEVSFTKLLGTGQEAKQFLDELKGFAAATPFEFPDLLQAAQRMKAMGFEATAVIPMLRAIGDQVASMGGSSEQIDRITRALGQMQAKGKVSAEEMMQLAEANVNGWQMVADKLGISIPEAMDRSKRGVLSAAEAIPAILEGMAAQTQGQMENMSKTVTGQFSNMKDRITFIVADVGKALLPVAGTVLQMAEPILDVIGKMAQGFASMPSPVQAFIVSIGAVAAAVGPLAVMAGGFISTLTSLGSAFGVTGGAAAVLSAGAAALGPVILGVATAVGVLVAAWEAWKTDTVQDAIHSLSAALGEFWNSYISPVTEALYEFGRGVASLAAEFVGAKLDAIWKGIGDAAGVMWGSIKSVVSGFVDVSKAVYDFLAPAAETAITKIKELLSWINELSGGAISRAAGAVSSAFVSMRDTAIDAFNMVRERGKVSSEATQAAIVDLAKALKTAEENFKAVTEKFQAGKATQDQLTEATRRLTDAKKAYSSELQNFQPVIDRAKKAMEDARKEYANSQTALAVLNRQVQEGKPVAEQFAAAQQRVKDANENLSRATNEYKTALQQSGQELKQYDQGIGAVRASMAGKAAATNTAAEAAKVHKEAVKAERDEVALAAAEYKQAEIAYKAGRISMEELANASRLLQIAQDDLDPRRAAEHQVEANNRMIKAMQDTVKWFEDGYKKIDKLNEDLAKSAVDMSNKFAKAHEDMVKKSQAPIQITITTAGQLSGKGLAEDITKSFQDAFTAVSAAARSASADLPQIFEDGVTEVGSMVQDMASSTIAILGQIGTAGKAAFDLGAAIDATIRKSKELADAYRALGVTTTQSVEDKASKAQAAYELIRNSGVATATEIKQAHLAALKATADAYKANGEEIPKTITEAIKKIEAELKGFKGRWDELWTDMAKGAMDVFREAGQQVGTTVWDFILGKGNKEYEKQLAEINNALAGAKSDWVSFQQEIATSREEAAQKNKAALDKELADIEENLGERIDAFGAYEQEIAATRAALEEENAAGLARDTAKLNDALAERTTSYGEYAAGIQEKMDAAREDNAADLAAATKKLQDSLQERKDSYAEYVSDVADKIAQLRSDMAADLAEELKDLQSKLQDKRNSYAEYVSDINAKIAQSRADNAADLSEDLAKLRESLADKRAAYEEYVQDTKDKAAEITQASQDKLKEDLENLKDNLEDRKKALAKYVQDANKRLQNLGEDQAEAIDDETKDTKRALEDKRIAYERASRDLQDRIDRELAKGEKANQESIADWKKSLAEKNEDYQRSVSRLEEDLAEFIDDTNKKYDRQTNDIKAELNSREQDYANYVREIQAKQEEITAKSEQEVARQLAELQANLSKRTAEWSKYQADNAAAIAKTTADHAAAQAREEADLLASLNKRKSELDKYEAEATAKYQESVAKHNAKLAKEEADLQASLAKRKEDLDKYEADTAKKIDEATEKYAAQLNKELSALQKSLDDKKKELDKYAEDTAKKQAELVEKYATELAKDEATLSASLDKKRNELEKYKEDAAKKAQQVTEKYAEQLAEQELELSKSLEKQRREYDAFVADQTGKLKELEEKHRGFWGTLGQLGKDTMEALGRKMTEVGIDKLFDKLSDEIMPRLKSVFETVFESIGGAVRNLFTGHLSGFADFFTKTVPDFLGNVASGFGTAISTMASAVGDFVGNHLSKIANWFGKFATEIIPDAISHLGGFFSRVGDWIGGVFGGGGSAASSAVGSVGGAAGGVAGGIGSAAGGVAGAATSMTASLVTGAVSAIGSIVGGLITGFMLTGDAGKTEENTRGTLEQLRHLQNTTNQYLPKLQDMIEYYYRNQLPALASITDELVDKFGVVSRILGFDTRTWLYEIRDAAREVTEALMGSNFSDMRNALVEVNAKLDTVQVQLDSIYQALGGKSADPIAAVGKLEGPLQSIKSGIETLGGGFVTVSAGITSLESSIDQLDYSSELVNGFSSVNSAIASLNLRETLSGALASQSAALSNTVQGLNIPSIVTAVANIGTSLQSSISALDLRGSITSLLSNYTSSISSQISSQYSSLANVVASRPASNNFITVQAIAPQSTSPMSYAQQVGNLLTNAIK